MKTLKVFVIALFLVLLGTVIAQAQDNACVYPYSFINRYGDSFAFCLTSYGTLASLQSPIGNEQLDPTNPLEGFSLTDNSGFTDVGVDIYPGFHVGEGPPTVKQPKGPGKLPIIFKYKHVTSTVTAVPTDKSVVFTMTVGRIDYQYEWGWGPFYRAAGLLVDGLGNNTFANSGFAAFSYNPAGHEVMISGAFTTQSHGSGEAYGSVAQNYMDYGQYAVIETGAFVSVRVAPYC